MRNDHKKIKGKLYGVGIGPGDPELLTLKAKELVERARTIFIPRGKETSSSCARGIIEKIIRKKKKFVELTFPMTKDEELLKRSWESAAGKIAETIRKERTAVFVTIGDPLIYSTYVYLMKTMRKAFPRINLETVPGISAFNAASSRLGIPLAKGDERLAVIPVTKSLNKVKTALREFDTVVLMKVGSKLDKVVKLLTEMNLIKNAALVSRLGQPGEKIIGDLTLLKDRSEAYFSVIIVRKDKA